MMERATAFLASLLAVGAVAGGYDGIGAGAQVYSGTAQRESRRSYPANEVIDQGKRAAIDAF